MLKTISKISRHVENLVKNIVLKMHYRFQHVLKFSFQHALQISTCITDFNMCWNFQNAFSRCFQHISNIKIHLWYEPCWKLCWKPCQIFQSVLKTMLKISRHVENNVKNFKVCQKSPWRDPSLIAVTKIKSDIINEDYRSLWCYMWSVIEILYGLEEKIGPVCMQLLHNVHAMENF